MSTKKLRVFKINVDQNKIKLKTHVQLFFTLDIKKVRKLDGCPWLMPIIPDTWEAKIWKNCSSRPV
jgi:hypothetical protein